MASLLLLENDMLWLTKERLILGLIRSPYYDVKSNYIDHLSENVYIPVFSYPEIQWQVLREIFGGGGRRPPEIGSS